MPVNYGREADFYVTVQSNTPGVSMSGPFSRKSGGGLSRQFTDVRDGGGDIGVVAGFAAWEEMELSRPYVAERDAPINTAVQVALGRNSGQVECTVAVTPTDADSVPLAGATDTYDAILTGFTPPNVDADSVEPARSTYRFKIRRLA